MAPSKASWSDEDNSSSPASPAVIATRRKFDDEEDEDVADDWDAAEDSEEEAEKKKAEAAKAAAAPKAPVLSKSQRIELRRQENLRRRQAEEEEESSDEDDAARKARLREEEKAGDMKFSEDLFGGVGSGPSSRSSKPAIVQEGDDPTKAIDLNSLKLFDPNTVKQFADLREVLAQALTKNSKKPQYASFVQELSKLLAKDMDSNGLKKLSSTFATMSNEALKQEKLADKGGKKTKAAKTKTSLSANRDIASRADTTVYEDGLDDGDFM